MEPDPIYYRRRWYLSALCWCLVLLAGNVIYCVEAADDSVATQAVLSPRVWNAGFLQKVLPFVTWRPASLPEGRGPLTVGLLGHDPFEGRLADLLANTLIAGRNLRVMVITNSANVSQCQALFVPADAQELWKEWRQNPAAATTAVLTIGDAADFLTHGGIIQLDPREQVFYLNLSHAKASRLQLTRLVRLARKVFMESGDGPDSKGGAE